MNKWSRSRIIIQNSQLVIKINIYLIKFVHGEIWIMKENYPEIAQRSSLSYDRHVRVHMYDRWCYLATIFSFRIADWAFMLIVGWRWREIFLVLVLRMNLIRILKKLTLYVLEYFHNILVFCLSISKWPFHPFSWFSWNFDFLWTAVGNTVSRNHFELETFFVVRNIWVGNFISTN